MSKRSMKVVLASSGSLLAAAAASFAQDESAIDKLTDVITVTATKSADPENVQDVPLAVTAFNEDTLDALNVRDLEDLSFSMPNVSLDDIGTARGQANFSIRGLGVNSSIGSIDPAVGVFVDGVYLGINSGVVFDQFDLDSVEVVRGPQGILFGRNTTGGAVLLNTGNPTDEVQRTFRVAFESPLDDDRGGMNSYYMGTLSGPIIEGTLNGKFAAYYNDDEGYFKNLFDGSNQGAADTKIVRGALEYMPQDNLSFLLKGEIFTSESDGPAAQNRGTYSRDSFDLAIDERGFIDVETETLSLRTDWELNFGTLTNITGWRNFEQNTLGDIDSLPIFLFHSDTQSEQEQFSNELRYAGTWGDFDVKAGFFYFTQDIAVNENRDIPAATPITFTGGGVQEQDVYGLFSQVDWHFSDTLTLIGGLRYGYEEKEASIAYVIPRVPPCDILDGTCPTNNILSTGFTDDDAWQNLSPKIGFQYMPMPETQVYGHWTRGFRSGGYNFRITDPAAFINQVMTQTEVATDEEEVNSYELGGKFTGYDGRVQLNTAVFFTQIDEMQREVNLSDPTAGVSQLITNTADADIWGIEAEGHFILSESLLLLANIGYIDAEYTEVRFDLTGDGVVDDADEALAIPRVPEWTYGVQLIHEIPFGQSDLTTRVAFQHRDEFAYTDNNYGWIQEADMLEFDITWNTPVEGLALSVYGENLLDEVQAGNDTQLPFGGLTPAGGGTAGPRSDFDNEPFDDRPFLGTLSPLKKGRLFGVEATLRF